MTASFILSVFIHSKKSGISPHFSTIITTNLSFETATGSIDYPFTNDYMFRAILQKDKQVLKALIAALLHLKKKVFTM